MMNLFRKWNSLSLILRILIGLILGVVLGIALPGLSFIGIPGQMFVDALKAVAPILVFALVCASVANSKGGNLHSFRTVILLYLLSTFLAAVVSVFACFLFPITLPLNAVQSSTSFKAPQSTSDVLLNLLASVVANPLSALAESNYLSILFWAVVLGLALKAARPATLEMLDDLSSAISAVVRGVITLAPLGIMGLAFSAVSAHGLDIFVTYGRMVALLVGTMLVVGLVVNPLIVGILLRCNPYPLVLRCLRESGITAFFTRSSAANIPVNLQLCQALGLNKDLYSVSIPLGSTINMDGAAVTITLFSLVGAFTMGVRVTLPMAIFLSFVATLSACGASGVAGGSLLLIPLGCSLFGISADVSMQLVGVGFIIGIIQDSMETALNSSGDVLFTATAEFLDWRKQGKKLPF